MNQADMVLSSSSMSPSPSIWGRLIGVSLGPGDPDLLTRRAWQALQGSGRWTYPVKKAGESSYALDIVQRAGLLAQQDALPLVFPMTTNTEILARAWMEAAQQALDALRSGRDLLFLVEGDASTYSTFGHLARAVRTLEPAVQVEVIPGVTSFAASAARTSQPLVEADDTLAIFPASYGIEVIDAKLDDFDALVLMKVKPLMDDVIDLLERRSLIDQAVFVEKVGTPEERVIHDVASLKGQAVAYLSLLLVKNSGRVKPERQHGCRKK